jgi:cytochrome c553
VTPIFQNVADPMVAYARKLWVMKRVGSILAILMFLASAAVAWAGDGSDPRVRNCNWCHGTSGQGYTIAPRLAGQKPLYIETQLRNFHEHTRDNPFSKQYMWSAVTALRPQAARELAEYFSTIPPRAANDGIQNLAATGRTIYLEGIPQANIVSCLACHGPDAEGVREIPRLGGLSYDYLKRRLEQWGQGYHSGSETPMPRIATKLGSKEIEAIASYLSFVK